jgi:hypothetical protein
MVKHKDVSVQACGKIVVDAGLFAAQKVSHCAVVRVSWLWYKLRKKGALWIAWFGRHFVRVHAALAEQAELLHVTYERRNIPKECAVVSNRNRPRQVSSL